MRSAQEIPSIEVLRPPALQAVRGPFFSASQLCEVQRPVPKVFSAAAVSFIRRQEMESVRSYLLPNDARRENVEVVVRPFRSHSNKYGKVSF